LVLLRSLAVGAVPSIQMYSTKGMRGFPLESGAPYPVGGLSRSGC
jgi:hypothetical protein